MAMLAISATAGGIDSQCIPTTFGNGLSNAMVQGSCLTVSNMTSGNTTTTPLGTPPRPCHPAGPALVVINHTVTPGCEGVGGYMSHFWVTGRGAKAKDGEGVGWIDQLIVKYYVDGEVYPPSGPSSEPAFRFQPGALLGSGMFFGDQESYNAGRKFGKAGLEGAYFHHHKVPYSKHVVVTVEWPSNIILPTGRIFLSVRGVDGLPLTLPSGVSVQPAKAKLAIQATENKVFNPLQYVPLAAAPEGSRGMVLGSMFHVQAAPGVARPAPNWVEGCFRFYQTAAEPYPGLVVGTGARTPPPPFFL